MENNPWTIISEKKVYNNKWINVTEYAVVNPSGGEGIYGKVHFKNLAVGIVALDDHEQLWLVGQYRFTLNQFSWEIPEGGAPVGTDPLESAKRELKEETGVYATDWKHLLSMHLSNSVSDELAIVYLATGLKEGEAAPEDTEDLYTRQVSLEEAWQMVENGIITDSMSVAAITKIKLMKVLGQL
ncbi:MAG: NUDIX hydrolase [Sediminibacterium sp. Gen4]|jgi:8-oxo-dGTP pyrophosphatase MutT (NUDIX family)|uniref:NUDIX domain-containing protein n=2 Tax=Bacteria TaxID=2 RepID=UPI0015BF764F|nr:MULTISPECIES: NUDIX hydrolase [unclassified Sediminibacterium]MBW0162306.1 NUDIX hydrolase [Sediminibacterium sp.]MBW0165630.1 NUDIX hydrolase [Sediminibacterium sp.]NWK66779.1 NUDIX hydrolase [Sediminibacterium sp. Gen4]